MTHLCHICLLPIPDSINKVSHPLFGTRDHLIPRSMGGSNKPQNIAAAHYYCNQQRRNLPVTIKMIGHCQAAILKELEKIGMTDITLSDSQFKQMHKTIKFLCGEVAKLDDVIEDMYRERGFAR